LGCAGGERGKIGPAAARPWFEKQACTPNGEEKEGKKKTWRGGKTKVALGNAPPTRKSPKSIAAKGKKNRLLITQQKKKRKKREERGTFPPPVRRKKEKQFYLAEEKQKNLRRRVKDRDTMERKEEPPRKTFKVQRNKASNSLLENKSLFTAKKEKGKERFDLVGENPSEKEEGGHAPCGTTFWFSGGKKEANEVSFFFLGRCFSAPDGGGGGRARGKKKKC